MDAEGESDRRNGGYSSAELLVGSLSRPWDAHIMRLSLCVALAIHLIAAVVHLPQFKQAVAPPKEQRVITVRKYVPPPPKEMKQRTVSKGPKRKTHRMIPVPDLTPEELEPIREPEIEFAGDPDVSDVEFLIGEPEGPPTDGVPGGRGSGPLLAGVGDVTNPRLIPESHVRPEYPEVARQAGIECKVCLQCVVCEDGSIGELQVLRSDHDHLGFEESAIAAVRQWRYEPATQNGRPVSVYFTVMVDFVLQ
jgi:protein TonB